jgi:regulator of sigma D
MLETKKEYQERLECITKLITKWMKKKETVEKAYLILLKNRDLKLSKT